MNIGATALLVRSSNSCYYDIWKISLFIVQKNVIQMELLQTNFSGSGSRITNYVGQFASKNRFVSKSIAISSTNEQSMFLPDAFRNWPHEGSGCAEHEFSHNRNIISHLNNFNKS